MIVIQGVGDLTVGERVDALRDPRGKRSFGIALHLRLRSDYRGLPAGTEIVVGYADAGAAMPAPADPPAEASPDGEGTAPRAAGRAAAHARRWSRCPRCRGATPEIAPAGDRDTSATQEPPPGGFTADPPIDEAVRAGLLSGEYVFPVVGGAQYSHDFGAPRASTGFHQGVDLFAPNGTPLVAVHDGVVFRVGWNHLGGRRLWLDDGQGNLFYYAHLSAYSPLAQENAVVHRGDVIGFMGNSGEAETTPAHLHFEIHPQGGWAVPPFDFLRTWEGQPVAAPPAPTAEDATRGLQSDDAAAPAVDDAAPCSPPTPPRPRRPPRRTTRARRCRAPTSPRLPVSTSTSSSAPRAGSIPWPPWPAPRPPPRRCSPSRRPPPRPSARRRGSRPYGVVVSPAVRVGKAGFYSYRERLVDAPNVEGVTTECALEIETALAAPAITTGRGEITREVRGEDVGGQTPTRVRGPGIDAAVTPVIIDGSTGVLGVPADIRRTGWWRDGAAPGSRTGAVLIAGHVDSARAGIGAFFRLPAIDRGDRVSVTTCSGRTHGYRVTSVRAYRKAALPVGVFSKKGAARLVLVTCGGPFDPVAGHYRDNIVVTAVPA